MTNVRNARQPERASGTISRGLLVTSFLESNASPESFFQSIDRTQYNGFNLVVGTTDECWYLSNFQATEEEGASSTKANPPRQLQPGVYGLCNAQLETPWRKLIQGKEHQGGKIIYVH